MHLMGVFLAVLGGIATAQTYDYKVLATTKTSTMERELNEAAQAGYVFAAVMGGETAAGNEIVVIMTRTSGGGAAGRRRYKLVATSRTGTMQRELQQAGDEGFRYCGQTVYESTFGGREVVVILERPASGEPKRIEYKLLATNRTSTMERELKQAGQAGFQLLGMTVGKTAFGGNELVSILQRVE
ncbi:MAG: hypothetical protein NZV14_19355 [Bryobacteraceae bacterium]|nr:hypothetical protein [Bryobacteraceae bacterium]MDW8380323.1 hypothetical protein [Bryobacterales bacterium]